MDREAIKLIGLMELHLSHEYDNQEQKKADLDRLSADFFRLDAMNADYFSRDVWIELYELFVAKDILSAFKGDALSVTWGYPEPSSNMQDTDIHKITFSDAEGVESRYRLV